MPKTNSFGGIDEKQTCSERFTRVHPFIGGLRAKSHARYGSYRSACHGSHGWLVIHVEADGKPGPVIGYVQVPAGGSTDVKVTIDPAMATAKMFAMLHVDEGVKGTYEFPGADAPVKDGEMIVMQAFNQVEAMMMSTPAVVANEQSVVDDTVTVASAYMDVPGWLVIHIEADGKPGPVIGYVALPAGESKDIKVTIDAAQATPKLFAMLHIDAGVAGTYEFPGDDAPVKDGEMIVMVPFNIK